MTSDPITFNVNLTELDNRYARLAYTPTLGEQFVTACVGPYQAPYKLGTASYFAPVPLPIRVTGGYFYLYSTVKASATDYLAISLSKRDTTGAFSNIVTGYTNTGGENSWVTDLTYGRCYSWNAFVFNPGAADLDPGDTLAFGISAQKGAPAAPNGQVGICVSYVPRRGA